jgi:hypothetical protein
VPDGFAIFDDAAQLAIDYIAAMTDGQLTFNKMSAGTLVGAFEVFDAVSPVRPTSITRLNTTSSTSTRRLPSSPPCPSA